VVRAARGPEKPDGLARGCRRLDVDTVAAEEAEELLSAGPHALATLEAGSQRVGENVPLRHERSSRSTRAGRSGLLAGHDHAGANEANVQIEADGDEREDGRL
jgi:hypothetical protein